jgi:hypothetical protein
MLLFSDGLGLNDMLVLVAFLVCVPFVYVPLLQSRSGLFVSSSGPLECKYFGYVPS